MSESRADQNALSQGRNFVWHELCTSDFPAAIAFYTGALDFGTETMDMGELGPYTMLTRNGLPVCGLAGAPEGAPPHWATYLGVDDVDERVSISVELGATVLVPAMDVPTVGRMALIQDPQGARIWLFKGAPQD